MAEATSQMPSPRGSRRAWLVMPVAAMLLGGLGFASTFWGLWSPHAQAQSFLRPVPGKTEPLSIFVSLPEVEVPVAGSGGRHLLVTASIETDRDAAARLSRLIPRVLDRMTGFLAAIDQRAYDRRGVLDIIKAELATRIAADLDDIPLHDLLITEFRFR